MGRIPLNFNARAKLMLVIKCIPTLLLYIHHSNNLRPISICAMLSVGSCVSRVYRYLSTQYNNTIIPFAHTSKTGRKRVFGEN